MSLETDARGRTYRALPGKGRATLTLVVVCLVGLAVNLAVLAVAAHTVPDFDHCDPGMHAQQQLCCGMAQTGTAAGCYGHPTRCALHLTPLDGQCVLLTDAIPIAGGSLELAVNDWEALGKVSPRLIEATSFFIDPTEVTVRQWAECSAAGACPTAAIRQPAMANLPVTNITPTQASSYCDHKRGRLPTRDEWLFAASSAEGYRYPWGQTGLVCRKAVFGMVDGPCGFGATTPSPVASRQLGATPTGLFDMSGNVAEWVTDGSGFLAAGGSFRSTLAGQLKVWSWEDTQAARDDVGFRCVYQYRAPSSRYRVRPTLRRAQRQASPATSNSAHALGREP